MLQGIMSSYNIFPQFWKCLFAFGCKESENEFEFPIFRARRSQSSDSKAIDTQGAYSQLLLNVRPENCEIVLTRAESCFILRRAELNRRDPQDGECAMDAWSIRQTAVYSRVELSSNPRSMFFLIAPSKNVEEQLALCLDRGTSDELKIAPQNVQQILVGDSLRGWMDYMACLEKQLKIQVSYRSSTLSPLLYTIMRRTDLKFTIVQSYSLRQGRIREGSPSPPDRLLYHIH